MSAVHRAILLLACLVSATACSAASAPPHSALVEVPFHKVRIDDAFWSPRIATIQTITVPDLLQVAEDQGKIDNLRIIAGRKTDGRIRTYNSPDSDLWKLMEAASYTFAWRAAPDLDRRLDDLIALYAEAQADDGYINQMYMLPSDHPQGPTEFRKGRYGRKFRFVGRIEDWAQGIGQLYSAGHLFEAAAAHYRATGKRNFLDIAVRMADCIARRFPPGEPIDYADHPQAGIGLVKLYEVTGEGTYLDLANHIVHHGHHGRPPDLGDRESWKPIRDQRKAWGHAVRIHYLYSAATDLCRYLGQTGTRTALDSLWHSIVDRRLYVTGGVGGPAHHEQLADDWVLDNARCYCECCANIAHGQWNHRLNLLSGEAGYADVVEIEAFNAGLSGISLAGTEYFYRNPLLASKRGRGGPHGGVRKRYLFCCPAKLPGFVAGIGRWLAAADDEGLYVNLYAAGTATARVGGRAVTLRQETRYPWDGRVTMTVEPDEPADFALGLRIPGWARGRPFPGDLYRFGDPSPVNWTVCVNGKPVDVPGLERGYLRLRRTWKPGDTVTLDLPMPVRRVYAHEKVEDDLGKVALMRGPVVYCLEGVDHNVSVLDLVLPEDAPVRAEHRDDLLGGVTVLTGRALGAGNRPVTFTAVPYYAWQNRGIDEMTVWLIEDAQKALAAGDAGPLPTAEADPNNLVTQGRVAASCPMVGSNTLNALRDGRVPEGSGDKSQPCLAWWPRKGSVQWAQCLWEEPHLVSRTSVYWFADHPRGGCGLPNRWRLLYLDGTAWKPVPQASRYATDPHRFHDVTFEPVTTRGLRIEVRLKKGLSGGIHEWRVPEYRNTDG